MRRFYESFGSIQYNRISPTQSNGTSLFRTSIAIGIIIFCTLMCGAIYLVTHHSLSSLSAKSMSSPIEHTVPLTDHESTSQSENMCPAAKIRVIMAIDRNWGHDYILQSINELTNVNYDGCRADLQLSFDGDIDRHAVIPPSRQPFWPDGRVVTLQRRYPVGIDRVVLGSWPIQKDLKSVGSGNPTQEVLVVVDTFDLDSLKATSKLIKVYESYIFGAQKSIISAVALGGDCHELKEWTKGESPLVITNVIVDESPVLISSSIWLGFKSWLSDVLEDGNDIIDVGNNTWRSLLSKYFAQEGLSFLLLHKKRLLVPLPSDKSHISKIVIA